MKRKKTDWCSVAEAAEYLDVSESVVLGLVRRGVLTTFRTGPECQVDAAEVRSVELVEERAATGWYLGDRPKRPEWWNLTRNSAGATCAVQPAADGGHVRAARAGQRVGTLPAVMVGHFATFRSWYPISNSREGSFLESVAPGTFRQAFSDEERSGIKVLLQHGRDPQLGMRPLGVPEDLREDEHGARYRVRLFDTPMVREVFPGLAAGVYGASWRFSVRDESWDPQPKRSAHNPTGKPERVIKDAHVLEFGPVLWGASPTATAKIEQPGEPFQAPRSDKPAATRRPKWFLDGVKPASTNHL